MSTLADSLIQQLNPFGTNESTALAEMAHKISILAQQVKNHEITIDEFQELSDDLEALKESAADADEVKNVEAINTIFNQLVTVLTAVSKI